MSNVFIDNTLCEFCGGVVAKDEVEVRQYTDLCHDCAKRYDANGNITGYCSISCCIEGACDGSCLN